MLLLLLVYMSDFFKENS